MTAARGELKKELLRKLFHCLSLVYLGLYFLLGPVLLLRLLGGWLVFVGIVETVRLRRPDFNKRVLGLFGGIHREKETERVSGVFWTTLGCWVTIFFFGGEPRVVAAASMYLAFGDGLAAVAGKAFGRTVFTVRGRRKSVEGSAACLAACCVAGVAAGLPWTGVAAGALTATAVELLPVPLDDNLWLTVIPAAVLHFVV